MEYDMRSTPKLVITQATINFPNMRSTLTYTYQLVENILHLPSLLLHITMMIFDLHSV
jgi:hypothetical protein